MNNERLPVGWIEKPLGKLVTFQKGKKTETSDTWQAGYLRYLGASGLQGLEDGYAATSGAVLAGAKDLLMLWDGERSGLVGCGQVGVVASTVARMAPNDDILPEYLYYFLDLHFAWIQARRTGTGVPHVPKDLGRILSVRYPSDKDRQKKVVDILQSVDVAINNALKQINKLSVMKQGMMADLFSRGIDPATGKLRPRVQEAPELYYDTQLGFIPKGWVYGLLKRFVRAAEYGISTSLNEDTTGIPVLRMNNIQSNRFDVSDLKYTKVSDAYRLKLKKGDVLYNRTNSMEHVGKTALWRGELEECSFASYLVRLNLHEDQLRPAYFAHWMSQVSSQNALRAFATPAVQQVNINPTNLQRVEICCPGDPHEQELIVERIDALDDNIAAESANLIKLQDQKAGLMRDLLTGKVPVSA